MENLSQPHYYPWPERDHEAELEIARRIGLGRKLTASEKKVAKLEKEIVDRLKESFWCQEHSCRMFKSACIARKERAREIFIKNNMKNSTGLALKESFRPCHNCRKEGE